VSKPKRLRQANARAAAVHGYTVRAGLAACPYGSCSHCRTREQQELLEASKAIELERTMRDVHRIINTPAGPSKPVVRRPKPFQKPPRRRHVHRSHPWRLQLWVAKNGRRTTTPTTQEETAA